jgi:hypothetical protein
LTNEYDNLVQGLDVIKKYLGSLQEEQSSLVKELDEKQAVLQDHQRIFDEQRVEVTEDHEADCVHFPHFAQTAIMLRCCIICRAQASPDLELQYCSVCQSTLYCSEACQRQDWRKRHKKICKLLNVGHLDMQVRSEEHTRRSIDLKEGFERYKRNLDVEDKLFYKLFEESAFEGSRAAARKMMKIAKRQIKHNQKVLLFYSLNLLIRSDKKMLSWPNSPLLVMLQLIDPSVLSREHCTKRWKKARK